MVFKLISHRIFSDSEQLIYNCSNFNILIYLVIMEFGIQNAIFILIFLFSVAFVTRNVIRLTSFILIAKPENRSDRIGKRIWQTFMIAFGQSKLLRFKAAGAIHASIFWGYLILLFSASQSVLEGFGIKHFWNFLGPVYSLITILTDVLCLLIFAAIVTSLLRRFVLKIKRLQTNSGGEIFDAVFILALIAVVVSTILLQNAAAVSAGIAGSSAVHPVGNIIAAYISPETAPMLHDIFWWMHIIAILLFMNYLPYSKHLHVYTSIPNVFFSTIGPVNSLDPINFEEEGAEIFGVVDIEDFSWKTIHDSYSCTHCGRCDSVCPAFETGKILSPQDIIIQIRERTFDRAPILVRQKKENQQAAKENRQPKQFQLSEEEQKTMDKKLIGDYISPEALWQCTTCGACMQECPVNIEHVPAIVGMRRSLVMMEAAISPELQTAFGNFETNATPWAFSPSERADWADGAGVKIAAQNPDFDVLFWVGCFGSFDDRSMKVSVAFSKLMQKAGVDFAILGAEEQCNGDSARRAGNEFLADTLIKSNIDTMNRYNVKKIVTTCPHCFNTILNEYPDFGGKFEVIHHSRFLMDLINSGKLKIKNGSEGIVNVAYHDSCYIGRYNEMYDEPRDTIKSIPGLNILEPERTGDRGFCCGAGGGQMFMEETEGKRVNIERTEELLATGAETIASNCPFCMTMLTDGVKDKEVENVQVKDIAEILLENIG